MPDVGVDLGQLDLGLGRPAAWTDVEEAQLDAVGHLAEQREVGAGAVERGAERVGLAGPDLQGVLLGGRFVTIKLSRPVGVPTIRESTAGGCEAVVTSRSVSPGARGNPGPAGDTDRPTALRIARQPSRFQPRAVGCVPRPGPSAGSQRTALLGEYAEGSLDVAGRDLHLVEGVHDPVADGPVAEDVVEEDVERRGSGRCRGPDRRWCTSASSWENARRAASAPRSSSWTRSSLSYLTMSVIRGRPPPKVSHCRPRPGTVEQLGWRRPGAGVP